MSLREFVHRLLAPLDLGKETLALITDEDGMKLFAQAFTSVSVDPRFGHNYQRLEFIGDTLVNDAVASYVFRRFPWNEEWLTLIKHRLIRTRGLGLLAYRLGFLQHVRIDGLKFAEIQNNEVERYKLLEDVFEAFIGACREAFVLKGAALCPPGKHKFPRTGAMLGTALVEELIFTYLDDPRLITIETSWEIVKDAKTRVQQLYEHLKWGTLKEVLSTRSTPHGYEASLVTRPNGQRLVYKALGATKKDAEQNVSAKVMHDLVHRYGYQEIIPSKTGMSKTRKRYM